MTADLATATATEDVARGERFAFGGNWQRFLAVLDEERIREAERSLADMLGRESLEGASVLDMGSGSGLFSLAALRLGAGRVTSVDHDPQSVACTAEVRRRFASGDARWDVRQGSLLDRPAVEALGSFDLVYCWGVVHHTGAMWRALAHLDGAVAPGGRLFVAVYNDQGARSRLWRHVKRTYNRLPERMRVPFVVAIILPRESLSLAKALVERDPLRVVRYWTRYKSRRGMSRWHDWVDWIGGYPFEVARPEAVFDFFHARGYVLERLVTCGGGLGCNELVLRREAGAA